MSEFVKRTLTGIVFLVVLIGCMLWSHFAFASLFLIITLLGFNEYLNLVNRTQNIQLQKGPTLVTGLLIYLTIALVAIGLITTEALVIGLFFVFIPFIDLLFLKKENPAGNAAFTLLGFLYVIIPFGSLNFLMNPAMQYGNSSYKIILGFFILIWVYDVFAYLIGSLIGRHKLFAEISPGKTWEGTVGAAVFTLAAGYLSSQLFNTFIWYHWMIIALMIVIFGTLGDLIESMLKRSVNIKDSGNLLPGHGGVLDRFDGVLLSAPMVLIYIVLFV